MANLLKRLGSSLFEDGIPVAGLVLSVTSLLIFYLFGMADVVIPQVMPFDDVSQGQTSLLHTYFLDFSGVFSSLVVVVGLIGFICAQMLLINFYLQTRQAKWLFVIGVLVAIFYGLVAYVVPQVKNLEKRYTGNGLVAPHVLNQDYNTAYGIVGSEKLSGLDQAYLNAQISAYQYISAPNDENQELLNADSMGLEIALVEEPYSALLVNSDVVSKIYQLSTNQSELPVLKVMADDLKKKEWGLSVLIALLYAVVIFKIVKYRREVGF